MYNRMVSENVNIYCILKHFKCSYRLHTWTNLKSQEAKSYLYFRVSGVYVSLVGFQDGIPVHLWREQLLPLGVQSYNCVISLCPAQSRYKAAELWGACLLPGAKECVLLLRDSPVPKNCCLTGRDVSHDSRTQIWQPHTHTHPFTKMYHKMVNWAPKIELTLHALLAILLPWYIDNPFMIR